MLRSAATVSFWVPTLTATPDRTNQMKVHHTVRLIVAAIIIGMGWNTISVGIRAVKAFDRAVADKVEEIAELTD